MNKKFKGFSLAELLISLLVISIVLSAAIPAITRKAGQQRELIWRWTDQNNVAFSATGANQSVIVGLDSLPMENSNLYDSGNAKNSIMYDTSYISDDISKVSDAYLQTHMVPVGKLSMADAKMNNSGDKITILKRKIDNGFSDFVNSHIAFFNMDSGADVSTPEYAGRLTMDTSSIALGKGTLLSIDPCVKNASGVCLKDGDDDRKLAGENTAIGHYALERDTQGFRNTAVGKKALLTNFKGSFNTALGFASAYYQGKSEEYATTDSSLISNENTAVGNEAQYFMRNGSYNTTLGSQAMKYVYKGDYNTAIGKHAWFASTGDLDASKDVDTQSDKAPQGNYNTILGAKSYMNFKQGNGNTALGYSACEHSFYGNYNICIGNQAAKYAALGKDKYGLYIGGYSDDDTYKNAPLIAGHTAKTEASDTNPTKTGGYDQELVINARKVSFQPYMGHFPIFQFQSIYGNKDSAGNYNQNGYYKVVYNDNGTLKTNDSTYPLQNRFGIADFNLMDSGNNGTGSSPQDDSLRLRFEGEYPNLATGKMLVLNATNPNVASTSTYRYDKADIYINDMLLIDFPKILDTKDQDNQIVNIALYDSPDTTVERSVAVSGGTANRYVKQNQTTKIPLAINGKLQVTYNVDTPQMLLNADKGFHVSTVNETTASYIQLKKGENNAIQLKLGKTPNNAANADKNAQREFYITQKGMGMLSLDAPVKIEGNIDSHFTMGLHRWGATTEHNELSSYDLNIDGFYEKYTAKSGVKLQATSLIYLIGQMSNDIRGVSSDINLKNILGDNTAGLKEINQLQVKNFTYKEDKNKTPRVGVIAQQVQKIFPNAVSKDDDGYLRLRTEDIFFAMVNSIKELFNKVQDLTAKVVGLDKKITELEAQNKLLKEQNAVFEKRFIELEKKQAALEKKQVKLQKQQAVAQ